MIVAVILVVGFFPNLIEPLVIIAPTPIVESGDC